MSQIKRDFTVAFQLAAVSRYSRDHMMKPESVLEHIGFCTFYGLLLAERIEEKGGTRFHWGQLFKAIASHDLDEAIVGDIPRTTKYFSEGIREEFKKVESSIMLRLDKWLGTKMYQNWYGAKKGVEGQILKVVDIAAVVYKNWTEIEMLRNRSFLRVALETQKVLDAIVYSDFIAELHSEIEDLKHLNLSIIESFMPRDEDRMFFHMKGEDQ